MIGANLTIARVFNSAEDNTSISGAKLLGGVGGCDTPPKSDWQGNWLFLHGKMQIGQDEQKYETGFEKKYY